MAGQEGRLPAHLRHVDLTERPLCQEAQNRTFGLGRMVQKIQIRKVRRCNRAICCARVSRIVRSVDQIRFVKS
jgi:hypothetical protein